VFTIDLPRSPDLERCAVRDSDGTAFRR